MQSEAGVEQLGQLIFGYNAANQKFDIDYVRVRRADGSLVTATPDALPERSELVLPSCNSGIGSAAMLDKDQVPIRL